MTAAKNIHQRLADVMGEVTYIQKERKQGMQYTIVSHDKVTSKVRPALLKHGIVYYPVRCEHTQNGNRAECSMTIRFVNVDEPADFFEVPTFGYGIDNQDKGPGKAMSYAVKYALLKALGLETGDDPDQDDIPHGDDPEQKPAEPTGAELRDKLKKQIAKSSQDGLKNAWENNAEFRARIASLPTPMRFELKTDAMGVVGGDLPDIEGAA